MAVRGIVFLLSGLLLGGCMQATLDPVSDASFTARDRKLLANPPYEKATIPLTYQRHVVQYHRKEAPGSILVDTAERLHYVLPDKATRGDRRRRASAGRGGRRKEEWAGWTPTEEKSRVLASPLCQADTIRWAPGDSFSGNQDNFLFRIHGIPSISGRRFRPAASVDQRGHDRSLQSKWVRSWWCWVPRKRSPRIGRHRPPTYGIARLHLRSRRAIRPASEHADAYRYPAGALIDQPGS